MEPSPLVRAIRGPLTKKIARLLLPACGVVVLVYLARVLILGEGVSARGWKQNVGSNAGEENPPLGLVEIDLLKGSEEGKLDVVVVEEHHEVLAYWFAAIEKGILPKSDNVLIHIDGHSDLAPPGKPTQMAGFQYPQNERQFRALLQRNDFFILAAAMAGVLSDVIWVEPEWATAQFGTGATTCTLEIGTFTYTEFERSLSGYCVCYEECVTTDKSVDILPDDCTYTSAAGLIIEDEEFHSECHTEKQTMFHVIQADTAEKHLARFLPSVASQSGLILDIDLDYYGCERRFNLLTSAGLSWEQVIQLNHVLSVVFCVSNAQDELALNIALLATVAEATRTINDRSQAKTSWEKLFSWFASQRAAERRRVYSVFETHDATPHLCHGDRVPVFLDEFMDTLLELKVEQLAALASIEFCLSTSPRTLNDFDGGVLGDNPDGAMAICHGSNVPPVHNQVYVPTLTQVKVTTGNLRFMLNNIRTVRSRPNVVTVCRSFRDGYLPKLLKGTVEADVFTELRLAFTNLSVIYDRYLMASRIDDHNS